jgi:hypothetical protein
MFHGSSSTAVPDSLASRSAASNAFLIASWWLPEKDV